MKRVIDAEELSRRPAESACAWYDRLMQLDPNQLSALGQEWVGTKRREAARASRLEEASTVR